MVHYRAWTIRFTLGVTASPVDKVRAKKSWEDKTLNFCSSTYRVSTQNVCLWVYLCPRFSHSSPTPNSPPYLSVFHWQVRGLSKIYAGNFD